MKSTVEYIKNGNIKTAKFEKPMTAIDPNNGEEMLPMSLERMQRINNAIDENNKRLEKSNRLKTISIIIMVLILVALVSIILGTRMLTAVGSRIFCGG